MSRSAARQLPGLALATLIGVCPCASPQSAAQTPDAAIVQGALQPRIVPPPATYRFPNGKKFVYAVEWHLVTAGTATIQFDPDGGEEKLTATAATSGAVNFIYPVHSWFEARIDARTFCSKRIFKHSEEGKRKKETQIVVEPIQVEPIQVEPIQAEPIQIDSGRGKTVLDEKNLKTGESRHQEDDAPACATDILSGFFYLGSLPLLPENAETLPVVDGGKATVVRARVEAREEIKVPAGDFHAIRVLLDPVTGKFQGKGQIWAWFSDDAARTPIQMKAKLPWGTVMFRLLRIEK